MRGRIDMKSVVVGLGLAALLLLVAGVARSGGDVPMVGRFQIACTSAICYLVDTTNGEVWSTGDQDFWQSKLGGGQTPQAPTEQVAPDSPFVGLWISDDPNSSNVTMTIAADGTAIATDGATRYEGRWRTYASHIVINLGQEVLTGMIQDDGRLLVGAPDNEENRVAFHKVQP